jgi:chaperonin cofactor prefoldin
MDVDQEVAESLKNRYEFKQELKELEYLRMELLKLADSFADIGNEFLSKKLYRFANDLQNNAEKLDQCFETSENEILKVNRQLNGSMFDTIMLLADKKDKES